MQISKCFPLRYKDYYQQAALIEAFSGHRELLRSPVDNSWRTHALLCMCSIWILDTWKEHQTEEFLGLVRGPFVLTCNPFMVGAKFKWEYFRDTQCSCTLQWQSGLEIMCGDKSSPRPGPILRYCRVSCMLHWGTCTRVHTLHFATTLNCKCANVRVVQAAVVAGWGIADQLISLLKIPKTIDPMKTIHYSGS